MKKLILIVLAMMAVLATSYGQDTTRVQFGVRYYVDSLTTAKDTVDFAFDVDAIKTDKVSIFALSSAVDTVNVYTNSPDATKWSQVGLTDMASNSVVASIFGTTTQKELVVLSPDTRKIRLVSTSNDGSVIYVIVCAKRSLPYEN